jgi:cellobiose phosphorylase
MYRLAIESLLGLRLEVDRLHVDPLMPPAWPSFDVSYRYRETTYHIHVRNLGSGGRNLRRVTVDGVDQPALTIPLRDDGIDHHADVEVGADSAAVS